MGKEEGEVLTKRYPSEEDLISFRYSYKGNALIKDLWTNFYNIALLRMLTKADVEVMQC